MELAVQVAVDRTAGAWPALAEEVERLEESVPAPLLATAIADGTGEDERVHIRGSHRNLGESVPRRLPVALATEPQLSIEQGSGRRELAERLTSRDNPLLARVIVNRLWHHLMGRGIVATVDDFGAMGQAAYASAVARLVGPRLDGSRLVAEALRSARS